MYEDPEGGEIPLLLGEGHPRGGEGDSARHDGGEDQVDGGHHPHAIRISLAHGGLGLAQVADAGD
jgi:hypothetical protein